MGYIIVGGSCLVVGAFMGVAVMALCVASKNADRSAEECKEEAGCDE